MPPEAPPSRRLEREISDPLLAMQSFPYRRRFFPLGFELQIESNSEEILTAAQESWGEQVSPITPSGYLLKLRLGVLPSGGALCPPATVVRANSHLLTILADQENFAVCDLRLGEAFGWISPSCLAHRSYLRYHFLEAIALCLLSGSHITPIHGAAISLNHRGLLLCGESGAGKSTLAYACARSGWTFTSDDASYLLWKQERTSGEQHPLDLPQEQPRVRGNAYQVRFRPSARDLFPELEGRGLTPRTEGKPSIEVRTAELTRITIAPEASIHAIILLHRHDSAEVNLKRLTREDIEPYLEASLFPLEGIRQLQASALEPLLRLPVYEIHYRDLAPAIASLEQLTREIDPWTAQVPPKIDTLNRQKLLQNIQPFQLNSH
ncbi:MAG: HPr(Ser) kinase/phosphatase [Acidobacteriaceae bacterium]|nr:HPr(Ser) kinase/phosphatase [Acidobacteriaceae bacterium]